MHRWQASHRTYRREETIYPCKDDITVRSYLCISSPVYLSFINPFSTIFNPENYIFFSEHNKSLLSHVSRLSKDRLPAAALMIMLAIRLAFAETPLMRASACTLFRPSLINQCKSTTPCIHAHIQSRSPPVLSCHTLLLLNAKVMSCLRTIIEKYLERWIKAFPFQHTKTN
jgi:hypothetical protein